MQKYAHLNRDVKMEPFIYKKYVHLYRDVRKWGHSYTNQEKMGQSYTVSLEKKGLIVYLEALKKGAIRAAHPYHVIYRELPPPPPPPPRGLHTPD